MTHSRLWQCWTTEAALAVLWETPPDELEDFYAPGYYGRTVLHQFVHKDIVARLSRADQVAMLKHKDKNGKTPLHFVARSFNKATVIMDIANSLEPGLFSDLLAIADSHGWTPLHVAARYNREVLGLFVESGAITARHRNAKTDTGKTAYNFAQNVFRARREHLRPGMTAKKADTGG